MNVIYKTDKVLQLRSKQGRNLRIVREHYLREDVPCQSALCIGDCAKPGEGQSRLSQDASHYIVPDSQVVKKFLEILEFDDITNIIVMQTVNHAVHQESGRRHYRRLQGLIKDARKSAVLFFNEFQKYCYQQREPGEDIKHWQSRNVYEGATWYFNHLLGLMPVIMISEDREIIAEYGLKTPGVHVMTTQEYMLKFWPNLTAAHQLLESLMVSLQEPASKDRAFSGYLPPELLSSGLKLCHLRQGRLQVNKHNSQNEAFVTPAVNNKKEGEFDSDILIWGTEDRNRSVHGDSVVVELLPRSQWRARSKKLQQSEQQKEKEDEDEDGSSDVMPTGKVVGVLQRNWRDYVASFEQVEEQSGTKARKADKVLVIPFDWRIPKIRISTAQAAMLKDHKIVVRIDSWEPDSQYPNGHFVRSLGPADELETNIAALLIENQISVGPFSEGVSKELPTNSPGSPWTISDDELQKRRDLRQSHLVFSIDPKGCEDVDDTLSVKKLANGHLELGVHIADVTHFVKSNCLTDLEARSRSTTVYLADRRYDMLPGVLSADLCSLLSNVDRYAMSVIWELDANCEVVDVWYGKTVIRSAYKLFYEIAQAIHDDADKTELVANIPELQDLPEESVDTKLTELRWAVTTLMDVARTVKARRTRGGALTLEGVEVQVQLDKEHNNIQDIIPKQPLEIHETIAECMIFANHWVAKKICQTYANQALLRHHPMPRQEHFESLTRCAESKGFTVQTQTNRALADSLDLCTDEKDNVVNKLLRSLATQAMSNAAYFSTGSLPKDQFFHYGLALDFYTHFTSPIRRYADVIVHRLLMASLGSTEEQEHVLSNNVLQDLARHINEKHRAAQNAQKDSQQLFQALFFKDRSADDPLCIADAVIFQLRTNGLLVFIPRYGIKGAVYLRGKDGQVVFLPTDHHPEWTSGDLDVGRYAVTVNSVLGSHTYRLFDHITVRISVQKSHAHTSSLRLDLVSNFPHYNEGDQLQTTKTDIIKMVGEQSKSSDDRDTLHLGPRFEELKAEYGQTPALGSFYSLFQSFQSIGLLDV